jgi:uncharacterized protein (DUF924 family)
MHQTVLDFWFSEIAPAQQWKADPEFDQLIANRFGFLHEQAVRSELYEWRVSATGRLAEIIVLDQFSRNLHRNTSRAFAADSMALALAQEAIAAKVDVELPARKRVFMYMPFMHSESPVIHQTAERLFRENGVRTNYEFELMHKAIVDRFGRYPHRNALLGRQSTPEELSFLQQPGSNF